MGSHAIIINYTGSKGGGALDALEMAIALKENDQIVIPIISSRVENLEQWKEANFYKLVVIDTYSNKANFLLNSLKFNFKQKRIIKEALKNINIEYIYCPMMCFWSNMINSIFKEATYIKVNHDPITHSGTKRIMKMFHERQYDSKDVIIVHSKAFLDYCRNKYGNAQYIPLGEHNIYSRIENKQKLINYDSQLINFLFFGRISEYKGLDVLARAYQRVSTKYPNKCSLSIIGNGDFSKYKGEYDNVQNVTIINRWINDNEVEDAFLGENIICVCPYIDGTQSGVILVAYSYGVPVIATKTGGLVEQVVDGFTGVLIEPSSVDELEHAMERYILEPEKIEQQKKNIDEYLQSISWSNSAKLLIDIMDDIGEQK